MRPLRFLFAPELGRPVAEAVQSAAATPKAAASYRGRHRHEPAARLDGEADLIGAFAHDLDGDHRGRGAAGSGKAAVPAPFARSSVGS